MTDKHTHSRHGLWLFGFAVLILSGAHGVSGAPNGKDEPARVIGTWTGESICAGNRPACRNEVVVYRIEPISGRAVMMFADKILDGKRVLVGKLEFAWDAKSSTLSAEFTRGQIHGLWRVHVSGDVIEGT